MEVEDPVLTYVEPVPGDPNAKEMMYPIRYGSIGKLCPRYSLAVISLLHHVPCSLATGARGNVDQDPQVDALCARHDQRAADFCSGRRISFA